ncbi:MAG: fructoselysine/glucoselysine PTS system EIIA component [Thiomicrorhabdus sp.]|nr:MAG: fructoselysine/glucoselysine PTS system EIIA component [Thiomicrorhabdus sp.]
MDIKVGRDESGEYHLEIGPVVFNLSVEAVEALQRVVYQRLNQPNMQDNEAIHKKIKAYRALASKISTMDNRVIEKFLLLVSAEQLITLVRLSAGDELYDKVLINLSKQNRRQFEEDYQSLNKISEHHACVHMEQLLPHIKRAAKEQKELMD